MIIFTLIFVHPVAKLFIVIFRYVTDGFLGWNFVLILMAMNELRIFFRNYAMNNHVNTFADSIEVRGIEERVSYNMHTRS